MNIFVPGYGVQMKGSTVIRFLIKNETVSRTSLISSLGFPTMNVIAGEIPPCFKTSIARWLWATVTPLPISSFNTLSLPLSPPIEINVNPASFMCFTTSGVILGASPDVPN